MHFKNGGISNLNGHIMLQQLRSEQILKNGFNGAETRSGPWSTKGFQLSGCPPMLTVLRNLIFEKIATTSNTILSSKISSNHS